MPLGIINTLAVKLVPVQVRATVNRRPEGVGWISRHDIYLMGREEREDRVTEIATREKRTVVVRFAGCG